MWWDFNIEPKLKEHQKTSIFGRISVSSILAEYWSTKPSNPSLVDNGASFDTPGIPEGIVTTHFIRQIPKDRSINTKCTDPAEKPLRNT